MTKVAPELQSVIDTVAISNWHQLRFQVGKLGQCVRFVLFLSSAHAKPVELIALSTQPGDETLFVFDALDNLVEAASVF